MKFFTQNYEKRHYHKRGNRSLRLLVPLSDEDFIFWKLNLKKQIWISRKSWGNVIVKE